MSEPGSRNKRRRNASGSGKDKPNGLWHRREEIRCAEEGHFSVLLGPSSVQTPEGVCELSQHANSSDSALCEKAARDGLNLDDRRARFNEPCACKFCSEPSLNLGCRINDFAVFSMNSSSSPEALDASSRKISRPLCSSNGKKGENFLVVDSKRVTAPRCLKCACGRVLDFAISGHSNHHSRKCLDAMHRFEHFCCLGTSNVPVSETKQASETLLHLDVPFHCQHATNPPL